MWTKSIETLNPYQATVEAIEKECAKAPKKCRNCLHDFLQQCRHKAKC